MNQISENDKNRVINYINENDLDYTPIDNQISKFSLVAEDGMNFYIYSYNDSYIIAKYDKKKFDQGQNPYDYFEFKSLSQMLEQLTFYDKSLSKVYWSPILDSIQVPFDNNTYTDDWVNEFKNDDRWVIEESNNYKYLVFEDETYKPEMNSPFNTLHEVSPINNLSYTKLESLRFEIHPITLEIKKESYFLKLLCNNEKIMREYINYRVFKKIGLKLFLENLFKDMQKFKVK